jgi:hypothetical protein
MDDSIKTNNNNNLTFSQSLTLEKKERPKNKAKATLGEMQTIDTFANSFFPFLI